MHYIMNKNIPVLEIESGIVLNSTMLPLSLMVKKLTTKTVYNWINYRALQITRKNSEKIYKSVGLDSNNSAIELMYITNALSINDNFWIANDKEITTLKYEDINLFNNELNKELYQIALTGNGSIKVKDKILSAEYTGQGTYPKCFIKEQDGIYMYKTGTDIQIRNEIYAAYIAKLINFRSVNYEYKQFNKVNCSVSKIVTDIDENWEDAFIMSETLHDLTGLIPQDYAIKMFSLEYSNMIMFDALVLNSDRHMRNWAFSINTKENMIISLSTSYDYNNAFTGTPNTLSDLIFEGNKKLNLLSAARKAYREIGTSLNLKYLYEIIDYIDLEINKNALKNRIQYIIGNKSNQYDCY